MQCMGLQHQRVEDEEEERGSECSCEDPCRALAGEKGEAGEARESEAGLGQPPQALLAAGEPVTGSGGSRDGVSSLRCPPAGGTQTGEERLDVEPTSGKCVVSCYGQHRVRSGHLRWGLGSHLPLILVHTSLPCHSRPQLSVPDLGAGHCHLSLGIPAELCGFCLCCPEHPCSSGRHPGREPHAWMVLLVLANPRSLTCCAVQFVTNVAFGKFAFGKVITLRMYLGSGLALVGLVVTVCGSWRDVHPAVSQKHGNPLLCVTKSLLGPGHLCFCGWSPRGGHTWTPAVVRGNPRAGTGGYDGFWLTVCAHVTVLTRVVLQVDEPGMVCIHQRVHSVWHVLARGASQVRCTPADVLWLLVTDPALLPDTNEDDARASHRRTPTSSFQPRGSTRPFLLVLLPAISAPPGADLHMQLLPFLSMQVRGVKCSLRHLLCGSGQVPLGAVDGTDPGRR